MLSAMSTNKEPRKRKSSSRLKESNEPLTKKIKEAQVRRIPQADPTSETLVLSQTSSMKTAIPQSTLPVTPHGSTTSNANNDSNDIEEILPAPTNEDPTSDKHGEGNGTDSDADPQKALGMAWSTPC